MGNGRSVLFYLQEGTGEPKRRRLLPLRRASWTQLEAVHPRAQAGSPKRSEVARLRVQPVVSCCTEDRPAVPSLPSSLGPGAARCFLVRVPGKGGRVARAAVAQAAAALELRLPRRTHCLFWGVCPSRAEAQVAWAWMCWPHLHPKPQPRPGPGPREAFWPLDRVSVQPPASPHPCPRCRTDGEGRCPPGAATGGAQA